MSDKVKGLPGTGPDKQVITVLENLLERANKGEIVALGYVALEKEGNYSSGYTRGRSRLALQGAFFEAAVNLVGEVH